MKIESQEQAPEAIEQLSRYLSREENERELLSHLPPELRAEWDGYGHRRIEPAFRDRIFVLYQATGRGNNGIQRPPKIITTLRVISFVARDDGTTVRLLDEAANRTLEVGHQPVKVFEYPIFLMVPVAYEYKWDVHFSEGQPQRTASYLLMVKARNRANFFSKNNVYFETPNDLKKLYEHLDLQLDLN